MWNIDRHITCNDVSPFDRYEWEQLKNHCLYNELRCIKTPPLSGSRGRGGYRDLQPVGMPIFSILCCRLIETAQTGTRCTPHMLKHCAWTKTLKNIVSLASFKSNNSGLLSIYHRREELATFIWKTAKAVRTTILRNFLCRSDLLY